MWIKYNPNPVGRESAIDCSVRAVSAALDTDWEKAYVMIALNGYLMGNVSCADDTWGAVLRQHGYYMSSLPDDLLGNYTVEDFAQDNPHGTYVLGTGSHVVCVVDGDIYDSWDSSEEPIIYVWYRKDER